MPLVTMCYTMDTFQLQELYEREGCLLSKQNRYRKKRAAQAVMDKRSSTKLPTLTAEGAMDQAKKFHNFSLSTKETGTEDAAVQVLL